MALNHIPAKIRPQQKTSRRRQRSTPFRRANQPGLDSRLVQRALAAPGKLSSADILRLQRTVGNRAVQRLLDRNTPSAVPVIQRAFTSAAWHEKSGSLSRPSSPTLVRLDTEVAKYDKTDKWHSKKLILKRIIRLVNFWHKEHRTRTFFRTKQARSLTWLKREAQDELRSIINRATPYKKLTRREPPADITLDQLDELIRRYGRMADQGYELSDWAYQVVDTIERAGLTSPQAKMQSLFQSYVTKLKSLGFTYSAAGGYNVFTDPQANCQSLATGLRILGVGLGLNITQGVVSHTDFATAAGASLISEHDGNVKMLGEKDYSAKRFVFSMHVAAQFDGKYYDPTINTTYDSPDQATIWELRNVTDDLSEVVSVKDGATLNGQTLAGKAVLERDAQKSSTEFAYYWIVKPKPEETQEKKQNEK